MTTRERIDFTRLSVHEGPKQSPGFLLWQMSTAWRTRIEAILKPLGLTHPQFVVLAATGWLSRHDDPVHQVAIGAMAGLDPNTISQVLRGLEKKTLIYRGPSPDGRAKNVQLTKAGAQSLKAALPAVEQADAQFFQLFSEDEKKSLIEIFQKFSA